MNPLLTSLSLTVDPGPKRKKGIHGIERQDLGDSVVTWLKFRPSEIQAPSLLKKLRYFSEEPCGKESRHLMKATINLYVFCVFFRSSLSIFTVICQEWLKQSQVKL